MLTSILPLLWGCADTPPTPPPEPEPVATRSSDGVCVLKASDPTTRRWGCVDQSGTWVVPPRYLGLTVPGDVGYGMIGAKEREIIDLRGDTPAIAPLEDVDSVRDVGKARFTYKRDGAWGLLDGHGDELTPPTWTKRLTTFSEGRTIACAESGCGYVGRDGVVRGDLVWQSVEPIQDGRGRVRGDAGVGFVDLEGKVVIEPAYDQATDFGSEVAWVHGDEGWQIIDTEGAVRGTVQADTVLPFSEERGAFQRDGAWGFVDTAGTEVIAPRFVQVRPFSEGVAAAQETAGGPFGYVDLTGVWSIEPAYGGAVVDVVDDRHRWMDFSEGRAAALPPRGKPLFGYIDTDGAWVVQPIYTSAEPFSDGVARVTGPGGVAGVTLDGTEIVVEPYSEPSTK